MKFKLLRGGHTDKQGTHEPGAVVESDTDLAARFGANKFQRVHEATHQPEVSPPQEPSEKPPQETGSDDLMVELGAMSVKQLRQVAEDREIDLGDATRKDDIVARVYADMIAE